MIYIAIAAGIFLLELYLKNNVERHGVENRERAVCRGICIERKYHNLGAFRIAGAARRPLVAALSLALTALIAVVFLLTPGRRGQRMLKTGLALLLGGAFSNTYDRLRRKYVVDYFSLGVKWQPLRRIVFNISDFCIFIGAVMVVCGQGDIG